MTVALNYRRDGPADALSIPVPEVWRPRAETARAADSIAPVAEAVVSRWLTHYELLEPGAHIPMVERPEVVAALIREHVGD